MVKAKKLDVKKLKYADRYLKQRTAGKCVNEITQFMNCLRDYDMAKSKCLSEQKILMMCQQQPNALVPNTHKLSTNHHLLKLGKKSAVFKRG